LAEGKGSTVFLPAEATGVMGAVGALKELLVKSGTAAVDASKRTSGPVTASAAGYPSTRPTVAVRVADSQAPLSGDHPSER